MQQAENLRVEVKGHSNSQQGQHRRGTGSMCSGSSETEWRAKYFPKYKIRQMSMTQRGRGEPALFGWEAKKNYR
jgi:hypothetical protein